MKYTVSDFIMEQSISETSFVDLMCEEIVSEGAVLGSLCEQYLKQSNILQYMQEDGISDIGQFDIFSEGVIVEADEPNAKTEGKEDGEKKSFIKTVGGKLKSWGIKALEFIKGIWTAIVNFFKRLFGGNKEKLKQALENPDRQMLLELNRLSAINALINGFKTNTDVFFDVAFEMFASEDASGTSNKGRNTKKYGDAAGVKAVANLEGYEKQLNDIMTMPMDGTNTREGRQDFETVNKHLENIVKAIEEAQKPLDELIDELKKGKTKENSKAIGQIGSWYTKGTNAISKTSNTLQKFLNRFGTMAASDSKKFESKTEKNKE